MILKEIELKFLLNFDRQKTAANKSIEAIGAGRKYNRRFCKAQLQSGQDKQL